MKGEDGQVEEVAAKDHQWQSCYGTAESGLITQLERR